MGYRFSKEACYRSLGAIAPRVLFTRGQNNFLSANWNRSRVLGEFVIEGNIFPDKKAANHDRMRPLLLINAFMERQAGVGCYITLGVMQRV